jgi:hypothetical protein
VLFARHDQRGHAGFVKSGLHQNELLEEAAEIRCWEDITKAKRAAWR